jgi:hypothetical protein
MRERRRRRFRILPLQLFYTACAVGRWIPESAAHWRAENDETENYVDAIAL